jgi:hypothetical protein
MSRVTRTAKEDRCIATCKISGKQCSIKRRIDLNQSLCTQHILKRLILIFP